MHTDSSRTRIRTDTFPNQRGTDAKLIRCDYKSCQGSRFRLAVGNSYVAMRISALPVPRSCASRQWFVVPPGQARIFLVRTPPLGQNLPSLEIVAQCLRCADHGPASVVIISRSSIHQTPEQPTWMKFSSKVECYI